MFAGGDEPLVDVLLVGNGEIAVGLHRRADVIENLIVILDGVEVVARVEPESPDADIEVVLFPFAP